MTWFVAYAIIPVGLGLMVYTMYRDFVGECDRLSAAIDRLLRKPKPQRMRDILADLDRVINRDGTLKRP